MNANTLRRRDFVGALGAAGAVACSDVAGAQRQPGIPVIGFLGSGSPDFSGGRLQAFRRGLNEAGYLEGSNVAIEFRWAENQLDRLPALAADLVRQRVAVIVTTATASALAAKAATTTIPVVFNSPADPVAVGLVASLNRPGGNLTGATSLNETLGPKRLEILHELVPKATSLAALVNPLGPNAENESSELRAAARIRGVQLHIAEVSNDSDLDAAFVNLRQLRTSGAVIATSTFFNSRSEGIAQLSVRHAIPAIYQNREFAAAGGLMSYSGSIGDSYRQVGDYAGRILKGAKPTDLPVQQTTKVELIINMKTAKALNLTFPITLLGRADEVIE